MKKEFVQILTRILKVQDTMLLLTTQPSVVLVVGVNGVGKTTTIGKLAAQLKKEGNRVLLSAADTFRARRRPAHRLGAARGRGHRQTRGGIRSRRRGVRLHSGGEGPRTDVVIIDTAGRLHNKTNLMNELNKITRVIRRELPEADIETLMVLDATTGQNGLIQPSSFSTRPTSPASCSQSSTVRLRRHRLCHRKRPAAAGEICRRGEQIDDLLEFKPAEFVEALLS